jgi:branched-chain amino acid transport system substrate-binding protein
MKQIKTVVIASSAAALTGIAALATAAVTTDQIIVKIGHVAGTSGPAAHLGKDNENGARMAIEELNAKGTMIGGKKVQFVLVAEDDGADPKQATTAAQKLVDSKVNGVVGHLTSGSAIPASKIYNAAGIPQIAPSVTAIAYTANGYKSTFRVVANDGFLGATLGGYAVKDLNAKTVAVIDDRTAFGQGLADQFIKGAKAANPSIKMAQRQYTNDKATDFNAILTSIKASKPDVIFFGGMDAVAGPMMRQMKALGITAKFMGGDGVCTEKIISLAGDALGNDQLYCAIAGGVVDADKKSAEDFKVAYKKRFGTDVQLYAPYVYDSVMTMVDAMQQAKSANPDVYLPYLQKIQHKGVMGPIAFDAKGDIKNGAISLYSYQNGKQTLITVVH